ncbi:MAG: serine/threonine protein kinase, partial [Planctomycetota bacterium]
RQDLSREEALSFFIQTCRGVLALHDRRLVHFDLKPGNVFLNGDAARVGDYGLSKLMTDGRMTLSFGRGTPHYMAPEMLRGRADHRADIYSLGVMLFESIANKVPWEIKSSAGVVYREDDSPPVFPVNFPADLRVVIERCLRLDPTDRYDDVAELLQGLGQTARRGESIRLEKVPAVADQAAPTNDSTPSTDAGAISVPLSRAAALGSKVYPAVEFAALSFLEVLEKFFRRISSRHRKIVRGSSSPLTLALRLGVFYLTLYIIGAVLVQAIFN